MRTYEVTSHVKDTTIVFEEVILTLSKVMLTMAASGMKNSSEIYALDWTGRLDADVDIHVSTVGALHISGDFITLAFDIIHKIPTVKSFDADVWITYQIRDRGEEEEKQELPSQQLPPTPLLEVGGVASYAFPSCGIGKPFISAAEISVVLGFEQVQMENAFGIVNISCDAAPLDDVSGVSVTRVYTAVIKASIESIRVVESSIVTLSDVLLDIVIVSEPVDGNSRTYATGSIQGQIAVGAGAEEQGVAVEASYAFNTLTGDFKAAAVLTVDKPPLYVKVTAAVQRACSPSGHTADIELKYTDATLANIAAVGTGALLCADPDNPAAPRYNVSVFLDVVSVLDGKISLDDVAFRAVGYGVKGAPLGDILWKFTLDGHVDASLAASAYAVRASAYVSVDASRDPVAQAFDDVAVGVDATLSAGIGPDADAPLIHFTVRASFAYPCTSVVSAAVGCGAS